MNAKLPVVLSVVVSVLATGCGGDGLSEAAKQSCSAGQASMANAKEFIDNGPPEIMIEVAKTATPKLDELAAKADDDNVKSALAELSKTFADFKPDMTKVPTALRSSPEFTRYVNDFKAAVTNGVNKLNEACS